MENKKKIPSYTEIKFNEYFIDKLEPDEFSNSDNASFPILDIIRSSNFDDNYFDIQAKKDFFAGKAEEEKIQNENDIIKINEELKESSSSYQDKILINISWKNNKNLFNVTKFEKKSEWTNIENKSTDLSANDEITFLKRHRNKSKRKRRDKKARLNFLNFLKNFVLQFQEKQI